MIKTTVRTNTTRFLLPLFGEYITKLERLGLVNAYLRDTDKQHYEEDIIYAVFKTTEGTDQANQLRIVIDNWEKKGFVCDDYDYEGGYVVVVLKVPEKYHNDYKLFLEGKYSQLSEDYKKELKVEINNPNQLYYHIFNRTEGYREYLEEEMGIEIDSEDPSFEYWSRPKIEDSVVTDEEGNVVNIVYGETFILEKAEERPCSSSSC